MSDNKQNQPRDKEGQFKSGSHNQSNQKSGQSGSAPKRDESSNQGNR